VTTQTASREPSQASSRGVVGATVGSYHSGIGMGSGEWRSRSGGSARRPSRAPRDHAAQSDRFERPRTTLAGGSHSKGGDGRRTFLPTSAGARVARPRADRKSSLCQHTSRNGPPGSCACRHCARQLGDHGSRKQSSARATARACSCPIPVALRCPVAHVRSLLSTPSRSALDVCRTCAIKRGPEVGSCSAGSNRQRPAHHVAESCRLLWAPAVDTTMSRRLRESSTAQAPPGVD